MSGFISRVSLRHGQNIQTNRTRAAGCATSPRCGATTTTRAIVSRAWLSPNASNLPIQWLEVLTTRSTVLGLPSLYTLAFVALSFAFAQELAFAQEPVVCQVRFLLRLLHS